MSSVQHKRPSVKQGTHRADTIRKPGQQGTYERLTPRLMWALAAPHTWAAAIIGVLFSIAYVAVSYSGRINLILSGILLLICIAMQSAVNVFNDYSDFKKGTDSLDNSSNDSFDAILVYHNLNPRSVLALGIFYLALAAVLGIYIVATSGWPPLIIGIIGALAVIFYSTGKTPISYLPIGEAVSGIVMGGLIPLACTYVLSGVLDCMVLFLSLPLIIGIALILATNNTCDIEKDTVAYRQTLAVMLGRKKAVNTYHIVQLVWYAITIIMVAIFYFSSLPFMIFMLLGLFPVGRALFNNPLTQASRDAAMSQIVMNNIILSAFYAVALLGSTTITWVW